MRTSLALLPLLAPLSLLLVAGLARFDAGLRPRRVLAATRVVSLVALAMAGLAAGIVAWLGPVSAAWLGSADFGLGIRLDTLSVVMFLLVTFVGAIVLRYSREYLDGDPRQGAFLGNLCLALAAVILLVLSGSLVQLVMAWVATSLALHRLLVFYPDRPRAIVAARKKLVAARLGDACLVAAAVLLARTFGTTDLGTILEGARAFRELGEIPGAIQAAALLVAVAALLKSAQFPTHGWLTEVMETPTPVSALLHAGMINAGGFLVVRFADVVLASATSLHLLALVGGFTALFGSVVMLTQNSVKRSLAYSTVAQMGFMLFECGLGAFSIAVLHIVAHSLYKAHAFLASGSIVDVARAAAEPDAAGGRSWLRIAGSAGGALALFAGIASVLGVSLREAPVTLALGGILVLGITHLLAQSTGGRPSVRVIGRTLASAAAIMVAFFVLKRVADRLLAAGLPAAPPPDAITTAILILALGSFALVILLQILASALAGRRASHALWVHLRNGLYANVVFDRLVGATRLRSSSSRLPRDLAR